VKVSQLQRELVKSAVVDRAVGPPPNEAKPGIAPNARGRVPVVFGRGKPYFGTLANGHLMLEDPEVVIQGDGVLHLRYPVHR
jgi:hypothetical protein